MERKVFWCAECGRETQTMTIEQVMTLARMKRGTSSIWGTTANIHLIETAAGRPLVCVNSLGPESL
jgi:hypothetical protein